MCCGLSWPLKNEFRFLSAPRPAKRICDRIRHGVPANPNWVAIVRGQHQLQTPFRDQHDHHSGACCRLGKEATSNHAMELITLPLSWPYSGFTNLLPSALSYQHNLGRPLQSHTFTSTVPYAPPPQTLPRPFLHIHFHIAATVPASVQLQESGVCTLHVPLLFMSAPCSTRTARHG